MISMNIKILAVSIILLILTYPVVANDTIVNVNFDVQQFIDIGFLGMTGELNFTHLQGAPAAQAEDYPWAVIKNVGNVNETISMKYTTSQPDAPSELLIGVSANPNIAIPVNSSEAVVIENLQVGISQTLYAWINLSEIPVGTYSGWLEINSTQAP